MALKIKKKILKNPVVLGIAFVVIYFLVALLIPNRFPAASFIEVFIAIFVVSYAYVFTLKEVFSKKQKIWMAGIFFIFASLSIIIVASAFSADELGYVQQGEFKTIVITGILFCLFISAIVYLFLGTAANIAYKSLEKSKKRKK